MSVEPGDKLPDGSLVMKSDSASRTVMCFSGSNAEKPYRVMRLRLGGEIGVCRIERRFEEASDALAYFDEVSA